MNLAVLIKGKLTYIIIDYKLLSLISKLIPSNSSTLSLILNNNFHSGYNVYY